MQECKQCQEYSETLDSLNAELKKIQKELQQVRTLATKYEITLRDNGIIEKTTDVSDVEAICVFQIKQLLQQSNIQSLTETQCKILDILHKNLRIARGEKVEADSKTKSKKYSDKELLSLINLGN